MAWAAAMAYPEAVEKLVIINAPHPVIFNRELRQNPAQQQASAYMILFRSPQAEEFISADNFANFQQHLRGDLLRKGLDQLLDLATLVNDGPRPSRCCSSDLSLDQANCEYPFARKTPN